MSYLLDTNILVQPVLPRCTRMMWQPRNQRNRQEMPIEILLRA
jgi:hypothetical protein